MTAADVVTIIVTAAGLGLAVQTMVELSRPTR